MNYADPSIALGLLLMGMGIGAFLSREFCRRNVQAVLEEEIEKRCRCWDGSNPTSRRSAQPSEYFPVRFSEDTLANRPIRKIQHNMEIE